MPINFNDYIEKKNSCQKVHFFKSGISSPDSRFLYDLWTSAGSPGPGTNPSFIDQEVYYDINSSGAFKFSPAASGKNLFLSNINFSGEARANAPRQIILFDRFFSATTNVSSESYSSQTYTRNNGLANFVYLVPRVANSTSGLAAAITATMTYVNKNNITKVSSTTLPWGNSGISLGLPTLHLGLVFPLGLTDGDTEFKSITSITFSSTTTSNAYPYVLVTGRMIGIFSQNNQQDINNPLKTAWKIIDPNACINFITSTTTTTTGNMVGTISLIEE